MTYLLFAARWTVGLVFLRAATSKLGALASDRQAIVSEYAVLPLGLSSAVARALPWAELGVAASALVGILPPVGLALGAALLLVFSFAVALNLRRGRSFECGCGIGKRRISWSLVGRDLALASLAVFALAGPTTPLTAWQGFTIFRLSARQVSASQLLPVPLALSMVACLGRTTPMSLEALRSAQARRREMLKGVAR